MARQTEELVLDLDVNAAKYEEKLLRARKGLNKLKIAALKSKGGNEKLEYSIKQASKQLKIANLERQKANAMLKLNQIELAKTAKATTKLGKSQKRSNMAFTQAAYALDDIQYGFQGVQNNIQAMAVSMGASGPLVIGLTAVTIGIGLLYKHFEKAGREAKKLKEELSEKQGLVASMMIAADVIKNTKEGTEAHTKAMKELTKNGYIPAKGKVDEYIAALQEQMFIEAKLAANKKAIQDNLVEQLEVQEKINKLVKKGPEQADYSKGINPGTRSSSDLAQDHVNKLKELRKEKTLLEDQLATKLKITTEDKRQLAAIKVTPDNGSTATTEDTIKPMTAEDFELQDALNEALDNLEYAENDNVDAIGELIGKNFGKTMAGEIKTALNQDNVDELLSQDFVEDAKSKMNEIDEHTKMFRDSVSGAFVSLGSTIATNLGGNGDAMSAFLGAAIGTYTKLLATNKAFLAAIIPMKATEAGVNAVVAGTKTASEIPFGAFALPALIAGGLAAVSSAFSSVGASGGGMSGGGGGGRPSTSVNSVASPNPVRESARSRGSDIIIPVDQIRYGLQVGESNYGSSS